MWVEMGGEAGGDVRAGSVGATPGADSGFGGLGDEMGAGVEGMKWGLLEQGGLGA